jgi:hypothetical protein
MIPLPAVAGDPTTPPVNLSTMSGSSLAETAAPEPLIDKFSTLINREEIAENREREREREGKLAL